MLIILKKPMEVKFVSSVFNLNSFEIKVFFCYHMGPDKLLEWGIMQTKM